MFSKLTKSVTFPALMLILANILAFGLLFFFGMSNLDALYIIFGTLALFVIMYALILYFKLGDKYIMLISAMLVTFGTIMLTRLNSNFAARQIVWVAISLGAFFGAYFLYKLIKIWRNIWWIYIGITVFLFILTMLFAEEINGARRWLEIGPRRNPVFSFQPSELMRITFVMFLACHFAGNFKLNRMKTALEKLKIGFLGKIPSKYYANVFVYMFLGILVVQREWGVALLLMGTFFLMSFVFEADWKLLIANIALFGAGAFFGYLTMSHIRLRVDIWQNPWANPFGIGFGQIVQSLFAISSGGYFGTGIGFGSPQLIPEVHTDFIFSAIVEEMGIFGGVAVILLFFILCYRCFKIAVMTEDVFNKAVVFGLATMFGLQTFIIIGGVINFIPLTGVTLPFISYGGSSMVISFAMLGIVQAISSERRNLNEH